MRAGFPGDKSSLSARNAPCDLCAEIATPPPCAGELGSILRTNLRTNVDFQEKMVPSDLPRTIANTGQDEMDRMDRMNCSNLSLWTAATNPAAWFIVTPPDGFEPSTDCLEGSCSIQLS